MAFVITVWSVGCKKTLPTEPLAPIVFITPDSSGHFPGDSLPFSVKFTTDRPIDYIMALYDIDTLIDSMQASYMPTFPDTFMHMDLGKLNPRQNLYTYNGTYFIPDSLKPFTIMRFKFSFRAGSDTAIYGQNYPLGAVTYSKEVYVSIK